MNELSKEAFFTIGEVAKITGINPKSIRYYERIGILTPAMVDDKTGYRYYSPSQLGVFYAIQICVELGIPLQDFSKYYSDGDIDISYFLKDVAERSAKKMRTLEQNIQFVEQIQSQIKKSDALVTSASVVEGEIEEEYIITREIQTNLSDEGFNKVIGNLHLQAVDSGLRPGLKFGKLAIFRNGEIQHLYAFNNVLVKTTEKDIIVLPACKCFSLHTTTPQIKKAPSYFAEYIQSDEEILIMETELISSLYHAERPSYELRYIEGKFFK